MNEFVQLLCTSDAAWWDGNERTGAGTGNVGEETAYCSNGSYLLEVVLTHLR